MRLIHCGNVDMGAMYEPILGIKPPSVWKLLDNDEERKLASVIMIPVIGPRKTV